MRGMFRRFKNKRIIAQLLRPHIKGVAALLVINALIIFFYNLGSTAMARRDEAKLYCETVVQLLEKYEASDWLVEYWRDHPDLDLTYEPQALDAMEVQLANQLKDFYDIENVSRDALEAASTSSQRLYAQVCYGLLANDLGRVKEQSNCAYLYLVAAEVVDGKLLYLMAGAREGEKWISEGGDLFELGSIIPYYEGYYPVLDETLRTGKDSNRIELSLQRGADWRYVHVFLPVLDADGEMIAIAACTSTWIELVDRSLRVTLVITLITVLIMGLLTLWLRHIITRMLIVPLEKEEKAVRNYRETKDTERTVAELSEIKTDNEIEDLAGSFSQMVREIDRYVDEVAQISAEQQRLDTELSLAARIQAASLPSEFPAFPGRKEFDIYATMTPAKEVGGDFYDFFLVDGNHIAMVIADVSGKGVPAALFMMTSKVLIKNNATMTGGSPAQVLCRVNNHLCENNPYNMFVTVWLGIMEISTGRVVASNAGHEYPMLQGADGAFTMLHDDHGIVLGAMEDMEYTDYEFTIESGCALFVYTDGVAEAANAGRELFGMERALAVLNAHRDVPCAQLLHYVKDGINAFVGEAEQFDDITMLAIRRSGEASLLEKTSDDEAIPEEFLVEARVENLYQVQEFVDGHLKANHCPQDVAGQIHLAVEEVFVNISSYAYNPTVGAATIRAQVQKDPLSVVMTFIDNGVPYDPLAKEDPDVTLSAEEREIGGLGIFFVKNLMDDVAYEYKDGQNILTFKKKI